jgi:hypothetical protein
VVRVDVGEQEADGHRAEALLAHPPRRLPDRRLVERLQLAARSVQPPADLDDVPARQQRPRLAEVDVVQAVRLPRAMW